MSSERSKIQHAKLLILPILLISLAAAFIIFILQSHRTNAASPIVARVGDREITLQELNDALLNKYQSPARIDTLSLEEKGEVLKSLIESKLILSQADDNRLENNQTIQEKVQEFRETALINRLIEKNVIDSILTRERLKRFYDEFGGEIRIRQILVASPVKKFSITSRDSVKEQQAKALIQDLYQRILSGEDFAKIARQYSQDSRSASKGGDLGYMRWGRFAKEVQDVAFTLGVGEISKPVKSGFGYHIIQVLDRKKRSFEKEKGTIKYQLAAVYARTIQSAREKYYRNLAQRYRVQFHHANFLRLAKSTGPFYAPMQDINKNEKQILLASFTHGKVTIADLMKAVGDRAPNYNWNEQNIEKWARALARKAIALAEANRQKINVAEDVQRFQENQMVKLLKERQMGGDIPVSEKEMKAYFDQHPEEFKSPERVHIREILLEDLYLARQVAKKIKRGKSFAALANQYSMRPESYSKGGDLGFITQYKYPVLFDSAKKLKKGEISGPIQTQDGLSIFQVIEHQPAQEQTFEQAKNKLRFILRRQKSGQKYKEWIEKLKTRYPVKIHEDLFRKYFAAKT